MGYFTIFFHCATILLEYSNDLLVHGLSFWKTYQLSLFSGEFRGVFGFRLLQFLVIAYFLVPFIKSLEIVGIFQLFRIVS